MSTSVSMREALVVGQLFAVVPGQRFVEFVGKLAGLLDQRVDDGFGFSVRDFASIT